MQNSSHYLSLAIWLPILFGLLVLAAMLYFFPFWRG